LLYVQTTNHRNEDSKKFSSAGSKFEDFCGVILEKWIAES